MSNLKKKAPACVVMGASLLAPGVVGQAAATPLTQTPDQDEHHTGSINMNEHDPVKDVKHHPQGQWITDEWDRRNGTNSFANRIDRPIQYTLKVAEGVNESVKATSPGNMWDMFPHGVKNRYGVVEVSQQSVGDKLGPMTVNSGKIVYADYDAHIKSFIGRVRACGWKTDLWRSELYFGKHNGKGPLTCFVVWHKTTKEGEHHQQWASVSGNSGDGGPAPATTNGQEQL